MSELRGVLQDMHDESLDVVDTSRSEKEAELRMIELRRKTFYELIDAGAEPREVVRLINLGMKIDAEVRDDIIKRYNLGGN